MRRTYQNNNASMNPIAEEFGTGIFSESAAGNGLEMTYKMKSANDDDSHAASTNHGDRRRHTEVIKCSISDLLAS